MLPSVQLVGLSKSVVPEDLDVVEHDFDDLFGLLELSFNLVAIVLGILGVKLVDTLSLVLNPSLDVVQLGVSHLRFLVNLLGQTLQLLQPVRAGAKGKLK